MAKNKKQQPLVVQSIVVKAPPRRVYDVGDWRTALRSADAGRVRSLYDLFDDILIDGVLSDAIDKRVQAVLNAEAVFVDRRGNKVDAVSELIDTSAWERMLRAIMECRFFGRTAMEITATGGFDVQPIKPKYVDLQRKLILLDDAGTQSVSYEGDDAFLILGRPDDFGLLLKAAPYAIWKRGGFGDYAQWIELFGMPQRIGKYNTFDPESRRLLEEAFEKAGSAPYIVVPKESEIETKEGSSGSGSSYNEFRQANNEEILITILGQTLTTVQGERGARSLGQVHLEVEESKHTSDLRFVQRVLNEHVVPRLALRGYDVAGGKFVFPKAAEPLSVDEIVRLSEIIDIPASYIHEKYSIPMAEEGERIAGRKPQVVEEIETVKKDEKKTQEEEKPLPRRNADKSFMQLLRDFFFGAPQGGAAGTVPTELSEATLEDRLIARVARGEETFDIELFQMIAGNLATIPRGRIPTTNADVGVSYGVTSDALQVAMEINLFQFSAAKTLAEVQELNRLFRESRSFKEFETRAREVCDTFNRKWQKTEYDTALNTVFLARRYREMVLPEKTKWFPFWEYLTAGDRLVRESHRLLNGVILPWDDPRWRKIFPPNGWNCRCTVILRTKHQANQKGVKVQEMRERVDRFFETAEWRKAEAQGWGTNRALTGEIFTQNQFYIRKFPSKASKLLGRLYWNDWGLDSFDKVLSQAKAPMPEYGGTAEAWREAHAELRDYLGRRVEIDDTVFRSHTTGSHAARVLLLEALPDVLEHPDEVWLNDFVGGQFNRLNFIKFYKGKVIDVICEVTEQLEYRVTTWFEIEQNPKIKRAALKRAQKSVREKDPRWRYRRGLLIKKIGDEIAKEAADKKNRSAKSLRPAVLSVTVEHVPWYSQRLG